MKNDFGYVCNKNQSFRYQNFVKTSGDKKKTFNRRQEKAQSAAQAGSEMTEAECQKCDLALAYVFTSIDFTCNAMVRSIRRTRGISKLLKTAFHPVSKAAIGAKLTQLQEVMLTKGESVVNYSSCILRSVSERESADHKVRNIGKVRPLLPGLPKKVNITTETIMSMTDSITNAASKLVLRATRVKAQDDVPEQAVLTKSRLSIVRCLSWKKLRH